MTATKRTATSKKTTPQREHRRGVSVGSGMKDVSPVAYWYRNGHFDNEDEARGAFKLALQQGLDGMGDGIAAWMGLTTVEYDAWVRDSSLPPKRKG